MSTARMEGPEQSLPLVGGLGKAPGQSFEPI